MKYALQINGRDYICDQFEFRQTWLVLLNVESDNDGVHDRICIPVHILTEQVFVNKVEG